MADNIDFTGLPARLKDYTVKESENLLTQTLIDDQGFLDYMNLLPEVTDQIDLMQMYLDEVMQPGGKDSFNPKGAAKFRKRTGQVRDCKVDMTFTPKQINMMWKSFLGRIAKSKRGDVYDMPFQGFILDRVSSKVKEELRLLALFKGVHREDSTKAARVFDGILPLLSDPGIVPQGNIFAGTPVTQANAIDQLEGVADKVPSHLIGRDLVALVEPEIAKFYNRDYRASFGNNTSNTGGFEHKMLDGTNITIVPEPGLGQTQGIIIAERNNLVWLTGMLNGQDAFVIEKSKRNLSIMLDFQAASDFSVAENIWVNDLALAKGVALRAAAAAEPAQ